MSDRDILCVVTGLEHSGTTYLSKVLTSNPDLMSGFECGILLDKVKNFPRVRPWYVWMQETADAGQWGVPPERMDEICNAENHMAAYSLIKKYSGDIGSERIKRCFADARYIIDKTPAYIYWLDKVMAKVEVPFIVIRKTMENQYRSFKRRNHSIYKYAYRYLKAFNSVRKAEQRYGDRLLIVEHQELVADKDATMRKIYEFLDLPYYSAGSLEMFFEKTGFYDRTYEGKVTGLRHNLGQDKSNRELTGKEIGILKVVGFMQNHLPRIGLDFVVLAMDAVEAVRRRVQA